MKQNLNEQIARIKQLLVLNESQVIKESEILDEQIAQFIKKIVPALEKKFISGVEAKLGKKIATATDAEIGAALKSAEMAVIRKEIAQAVYAAEKTMIDDVFSKYNMSVASEASAAYRDLQAKGINKSILRDVAAEFKATGKTASATASKASGTTSAASQPAKFTVPDIEVKLKDVNLFDTEAVSARLKNLFPKAPSSDIQRMVSNLKKANTLTQQEFNKAYEEAIRGFEPKYAKILNEPSFKEKVSGVYGKLKPWQQKLLWISVLIPGGYALLKKLGIPVDKATGMIVRTYGEIVKDQAKSLKNDETSSDSTDQTTTEYDFSDGGIKKWLIKEYPGTDPNSYTLRKFTTPYEGYGVSISGGSEYKFKYQNGNYSVAQ